MGMYVDCILYHSAAADFNKPQTETSAECSVSTNWIPNQYIS